MELQLCDGLRRISEAEKSGKKGQESLWDLPRGRTVLCKSRRAALLVAQPSSPNGQLRRRQFRNTRNSASVCGSLTQRSHGRGSAGSRGLTSQHGAAPGRRAQAEPHRRCSARATDCARTGFRSTYRSTVSRCSSDCTGQDLLFKDRQPGHRAIEHVEDVSGGTDAFRTRHGGQHTTSDIRTFTKRALTHFPVRSILVRVGQIDGAGFEEAGQAPGGVVAGVAVAAVENPQRDLLGPGHVQGELV